ncbi:MAG: HAMP domain-containing histidine kinase [Clostridia bacterium]|nr:HAMP domain-containing histidine kinase [Clostridia bacterium]
MKNKSIFTRYISTFLVIVFLGFLILTAIISTTTIQYANERKRTVAQNTSGLIYNYLSSEKIYPSAGSLVKEFTTMINLLSKNAETLTIILTDTEGNIRYSTDNEYAGMTISDETLIEYGAGTEEVTVESDLGGIFPSKYGVVINPLVYSRGDVGGNIEHAGILFVCYSETVNMHTVNTIKAISIASLLIMIVTLVALYFITESIASPLRQMSAATKKFAAGKFDTRIPVNGSDEISELARSFNKMAESLAQTEYVRSSFLANVSHDLRTPMTTIAGFIDGILDGAIPPEKHEYYLRIVADEVRRLSRLVSQLLDISRLEAGNRKFEKTAFDICEMARIILLSFESKIEAKKLDVEFYTSDDRLFVFSDKDAINQVLYNICENAVKFSREGGKYMIKISDAQDKVKVSVYNEGVGIPEEDVPHVFDRFYKSDKSRGLDKTGVGLGLYISKTIMDNLDESIKVFSEYEKYCMFEITISKAHVSNGKLQQHDVSLDKTQK